MPLEITDLTAENQFWRNKQIILLDTDEPNSEQHVGMVGKVTAVDRYGFLNTYFGDDLVLIDPQADKFNLWSVSNA